MDLAMLIEIFGYIGSAMVVISMLMASVVKLRVINTIGSVISGSYALLIGSFPLALMNICLIIINVYNLRKLLVTKQRYDLLKCTHDESYINYFLNYYKEDMKPYFPGFQGVDASADAVYMVFCNADPAGILVAKHLEQDTLEVFMEYTTPTYRDCSIGKYLYSALPGQGVNTLMMKDPSEGHKGYLEKMGYVQEGKTYVKHLK